MTLTRRNLRSAARGQDGPEATPVTAAPTTVATTAKPGKGKKASSKSRQTGARAEIQPQVNVNEVVEREKAVQLAKIEDELVKKAKKAKTAHPRQRAPQQVNEHVRESAPELTQQHLPQELEMESSKSRAPVVSEDRRRPGGASKIDLGPKSTEFADSGSSEKPGDGAVEKAGYIGIEGAEDVPVDNDVEMNDLGFNTEGDNEAFGGDTAPPVKTPGKINKAVGGRRKAKVSNLHMQVKLNRQIMPSGSNFQKSLVDDRSRFDTPATKKHLTNSVETWAQAIPTPPPRKQISKSRSVTSVTTSNRPAKLSNSVKSCTTVVELTSDLPLPPRRSQLQGTSLPLHGKKRQAGQAMELTSDSDTPSDISDTESDARPPSQKHHTTVARTSKHHRKGKRKSRCDELSADSDRSSRIKHQHNKGRRIVPDYRRNPVEELTSDSDSQTLPLPKRKRQTVSRPKNHQVEDLASDVEEMDVPSTLYGGLQDEDDAEEEKAILANPTPPRVAARKSRASLKVKAEIITVPRNSMLPHGALEQNRWSRYFLPTFLKYVGGTRHEIWTLDEIESMDALQAIWNRVYSGEKPIGGTKVVHVVGSNVYSVVAQRVTEWRNSIGAAALTVVNDFFDSQKFYTTEERQQAAAELLFCEKYVYLRTRDVIENNVKKTLKNGRYRGPLVIYALAQHLIETENAIRVPGLFEDDDFPKAAVALSAVAVHRALELWEKGYITYESYHEAKTKNLKTGGIMKAVGPDGKIKKTTNFGRKQCERWSDQHCSDIWLVDDGKMQMIVADARKAVDKILVRNGVSKLKLSYDENEAGPSRQVRKMVCIKSDPEFSD